MGAPTETGDLAGTILRGRYELRRLLGRGGMGAVYSGFDLGLERAVAVKVILPRLAGDADAGEEMAARFRREARITAGVRHPHIVDVLDFDEDSSSGLLFLVMEQLEGRDLEKVLARERRLPPERAVRILAQVCHAVSHAHRNSQVHRDLKPSNVMLVPRDGEPDFVKVLDFGLARNESDATKLTATGQVLGTALYMAPEQIDPRRGRVTRSCDQYAIGAVAYHILAGRPPFLGTSLAEILSAHLHEAAPPLGALAGSLPHGLAEAVARALGKRPDERFPSVDAFREALETSVRHPGAPSSRSAVDAAAPPCRTPAGLSVVRRGRPLTIEEEVLRPGSVSLLATNDGAAVVFSTEVDVARIRLLGPNLEGAGTVRLGDTCARRTSVRIAPVGTGAWIVASVASGDEGAEVRFTRLRRDAPEEVLIREPAPVAGGLAFVPSPHASPGGVVAAWHRSGAGGPSGTVLTRLDAAGPVDRLVLPRIAYPSLLPLGARLLVAGHELAGDGRLLRLFILDDPAKPVAGPAIEGLSRPAFPVLAGSADGLVGLAAWDEGRLVFSSVSTGASNLVPAPVGPSSAAPRRPALAAAGGGFVACWTGPTAAPGRRPLFARFLRPGAPPDDEAPIVLAEGDVRDPQLLREGDGLFAAYTRVTPFATELHVALLSLGAA